ncbi:MAG: cytochrome c biogenesis protein CcsA [Melioribacteraceae bacterium]|nr:cytochrome c biogenesis protein CcsA [Melioribacteraceae bacterium]MCF8263116.1 cytochrome c biogenesis protein CcsA [Melioribacteraceae bacterium]MCF8413835.1 cytochrome c biogenesis protein CcsA [Melioribacteraceae bacterium]MCF8430552.1 cytochrome c biogenesis protein CcsA [Melioribacteraceae bacterium]
MIGNILVTLALLASIFTMIMYYYSYKGYTNTLVYARIGYHVMAVAVVVASALLLHAIITHDYSYKYVYSYSGSGMSLGLLISTFYAGQEGSFMLWFLFTTIVGLVLLDYSSKRGDLEPRVMLVFTLAVSFLALMVNPALKSPFNFIWMEEAYIDISKINQAFLSLPLLQGHIFQDAQNNTSFVRMSAELVAGLKGAGIAFNQFLIEGKGLNPLLQNFWMQIHPPLLFVGFSMATVPFAFAFAAMMKNDYQDWVKQALPWTLAGMGVLGLAIMLGGYWAYGVLGWGGYWGWDPVENSSLVPWIIGVASVHTLLVQKKTQDSGKGSRFVKTNLILSIMTYLLVLYSTFLTRSGILGDSSVHSFVDPGMTVYLLLVLFVGTFTLLGFGGIIYRWKYLNQKFNFEDDTLSRELALFTGAATLIASAVIILVGTSAPIFGQTVEIRFYNELNLPIGIIIGLINGLSLILKWKHTKGNDLWKSSQIYLGVATAITLGVVFIGGVTDVMQVIFTFSASFALSVNSDIAYKIVRKKTTFAGAYIAHVGIALFMLGVVATGGYTSNEQVDLVKGKPTEVLGRQLTFTGYSPTVDGKYAFNIEVDEGGSKSTVAPVMYIAEFNNSLMREPDILTTLTKDFYVSPLSYDDKRQTQSGSDGRAVTLTKGTSTDYNGAKITFESFDFPEEGMSSMMGGGDFEIGAKIIVNVDGQTFEVEPKLTSDGQNRVFVPASIQEANLKIGMTNLDASGSVSLLLSTISGGSEPVQTPEEVLSVEASVKPFINLVWLGVLLMTAGFVVSVVRRTKESQS